MTARISPHATIEDGASVGDDTAVWDGACVRVGARVGAQCVIGRGAFIDTCVVVGDRCKIQNDALIYSPARLADGVFIGPAVVLTNDRFPRAVDPAGELKGAHDWEPVGAIIEHGASVGARAVVLGGVTVGRWSLVAAGAVVNSDVVPFALVAGTPARRIGWVGPAGVPLEKAEDGWRCPRTGARFVERDGLLAEHAEGGR